MAWTDTCKIEACHQIEARKTECGGIKPAIRRLSEESGIPVGTLRRWHLSNANGFSSEPDKTASVEADPQPPIETCATDDLNGIAGSGTKFGTIYADPPWKYGNQATRSATDNHYQTMPTEDICNLPIAQLADKNAHLHLWTTNAFLFDAKSVMEAWGFTYKSCFVWVKPQMGIGNYWRVSHEFLLLGVKGSCSFRDRSQMSWQAIDRTKHSSKPERIRKTIELVSPGPYLELFARKVAPGWVCWGNEIERNLFNQHAFK